MYELDNLQDRESPHPIVREFCSCSALFDSSITPPVLVLLFWLVLDVSGLLISVEKRQS